MAEPVLCGATVRPDADPSSPRGGGREFPKVQGGTPPRTVRKLSSHNILRTQPSAWTTRKRPNMPASKSAYTSKLTTVPQLSRNHFHPKSPDSPVAESNSSDTQQRANASSDVRPALANLRKHSCSLSYNAHTSSHRIPCTTVILAVHKEPYS